MENVNLKVRDIISILKKPSRDDIELITDAFEFAKEAHFEQKRMSGEDYIIHPFETAKTLAHLQLDAKTIAAGLLHDVCEDNESITEKTIRKKFGEEIAFLVAGVTKLGKLKYQGAERQVESLRKMFLAMAKDIRVILIRIADRLHNMKTLQHVPEAKQKRIAMETLEIYAPLANRLGMGEFKGALEDLAFRYAYPKDYAKVMELTKEKSEKKEKELAKIKYALQQTLEENGIKNIKIDSRVKHTYSLFKKMKRADIDMNLNKIYDFIALRIITENIEDCYKILGTIHKMWRPLPGRIKDFIAVPKPNGYQSLHTTVIAVNKEITEIQIRTQKMHEEAEHGIAAHWAYSESGKPKKGVQVNPRLAWVNQLVEWQKSVPKNNGKKDTKEYLEALRIDFFKDRVFCFTPMGEIIDLPEGATAIDFSFAVHSEIGSEAVGAIIDGKFASLDTVLQNGNIVEIQTQKNKKPSMGWLKHTKTSLAKKHIKSSNKKAGLIDRIRWGIK